MTRSIRLAAFVLLLATPAMAASGVIDHGIDLWVTPADGGTFVDFSREPLPAGFLCAGGSAFAGKVVFRGVPVATKPAKALGNADTIIERLDDAVFTRDLSGVEFNLRGGDGVVRKVGAPFLRGQEVATTRIQVKAISFVSVKPVETDCGRYRVTASLSGDQPITEMIIVRESGNGGRFYAPLALNVRLSFTPVRGGEAVELVRAISFPAKPLSVWTDSPDARMVRHEGFVSVDTDADGLVDAVLPGTSSFAAGFKGDVGGAGRLGAAAEAIITPYCGGTGRYYAEHCHGTTTTFEASAE